MALRTSVGTGNWSAVGTWDTGVPVNGDTFAIAAGHTVTFDVDQSGMANGMGASSIAATGTLVASTAAGAYYLKMSGTLTLGGTLQAGTSVAVPYPSTCTFTIDFNSTSSILSCSSTSHLYLYCTEPTIKYTRLTGAELNGATVLEVDDDLTTDSLWANGAYVTISNINDSTIYPFSADCDLDVLNGAPIAASITITTGLTGNKNVGSYVALISRNIRIINSTGYSITTSYSSNGNHIAAEFNGNTSAIRYAKASTIGGAFYGGTWGLRECVNNSITAVMCGSTIGTQYGYNNIFSGVLVSGCTTGSVESGGSTMESDCIVAGNGAGISMTGGAALGTSIGNASNTFGSGCFVSGTLVDNYYGILTSSHFVCGSLVLDNFINMRYCKTGVLYNTAFTGTEFSGYDSNTYRDSVSYIESFNHNQVDNAFKAWCLGGIVTSQTTSPPTGHTIWYEFAAEDTTQEYPVFRQYETTVLPGTAIEVVGQMRIADGEDLSTSGLEPQLQIIDKFADPLVDVTQSPLDYDIPADVTGAETGWQDVAVIWANQGEAPRQVIVRMIAYNDGGVDTVYVDGVWAIASYKEDITEILRRVKRLGMTSEH